MTIELTNSKPFPMPHDSGDMHQSTQYSNQAVLTLHQTKFVNRRQASRERTTYADRELNHAKAQQTPTTDVPLSYG